MEKLIRRAIALQSSLVRVLVCASIVTIPIMAAQQAESYSLESRSGEWQDQFGGYLEHDRGKALVVAVSESNASGNLSGTLYFMTQEGGHWTESLVTNSVPTSSPNSGTPLRINSVAISGDTAVLMVYQTAPLPFRAFHTFSFDSDSGWSHSDEIVVRDGGQIQLEGEALAFMTSKGVAVYRRESSAWTRQVSVRGGPFLAASVSRPRPNFMRFSGEDLLVRFQALGPATPTRAFGLYGFSQGGWALKQLIANDDLPGTGNGVNFNGGYASDGEWMFFGVEPTGSGVGFVEAWRRPQPHMEFGFHSYIHPAAQAPGGSDARDKFGASIDFDSSTSRLLVGAPESAGPPGVIRGKAYGFRYDSTGDIWVEEATYMPVEDQSFPPAFGVDFGHEVAVWDNGVLGSAPRAKNSLGVVSGRLYIFEEPFGTTRCSGTQLPNGEVATLGVNGSNVAPHGGLRLVGSSLPPLQPYFVLASSNAASVPLPGGGGESFCVGAPRLSTGGARTIGSDGTALAVLNIGESALDGVTAGSQLHFQLWFRMPGGASNSVGLSNAVEVEFR